MSYLIVNIIFVLFLMYFLRANRHGLHMLQLEHYYKDRYIKWMKENSKIVFNLRKIILFLIPSILFLLKSEKIAIVLTILTYLILNFTFYRKKEKKAFVVTRRVRRQFITYLILIILIRNVSKCV